MAHKKKTAANNPYATDEDFEGELEEMRQEYIRKGGRYNWHGFIADDYPYKSAATPSTCPESCWRCLEQFMTLSLKLWPDWGKIEYHDDTTATQEISNLVKCTRDDLDYVRARIDEYGNVIAKRWQKWKISRRVDCLSKSGHRLHQKKHAKIEATFDLEKWSNDPIGSEIRDFSTEYEDIYMTSYLDIPTLSEDPMKLLAMMHYRSHSNPEDWILFDHEQVKSDFYGSALNSAYNPHCVVTYGAKFGTLVQWQREAAHRKDMIAYPCARHVFQAQQKVARFLRSMVELILVGDLTDAIRGRETWDSLVASSFHPQISIVTASAYSSQPFSAAPRFDSKRIFDLIDSRCKATNDELLQIQQDPLYLRYSILHGKTATQPLGGNDCGVDCADHPPPLHMYLNCVTFSLLRNTLDGFLNQETLHGNSITTGQSLPRTYADRLTSLEKLLSSEMNDRVRQLHLSNKMVMKPFRKHKSTGAGIPPRMTPEDIFRHDPMFWSLQELCNVGNNSQGRSPSFYIQLIDQILAESSEKDRGRIDQTLYDSLSDIAALDEALCIIQYHRSRPEPDRYGMESTGEVLMPGLSRMFITTLSQRFRSSSDGAKRLQRAIDELVTQPIYKLDRPSRDDLERHQKLHKCLAQFWHEFRSLVKDCLVQARYPHSTSDLTLSPINLTLSDEYKKIVQSEQDSMLSAIVAREAQELGVLAADESRRAAVAQKLSAMSTENNLEVKTAITRTKVKTRPCDTTPSSNPHHIRRPSSETYPTGIDTSPTDKLIGISSKSFQLFTRMFTVLDVKGSRTKWEDFVAAMVDSGCSATHSGGSAVTFEDHKHNQGSIVVHRPHPDSTIDPIKLHSIGKRLTKWFGWTEGTFQKRDKVEV